MARGLGGSDGRSSRTCLGDKRDLMDGREWTSGLDRESRGYDCRSFCCELIP